MNEMRNEDGQVEELWNGDIVTHRFVDAVGLRWHAATTGDIDNTEVIVFLHGFPETWFAWHHVMTALGDSYRCVALDLKGYGQSDTRLDTDYDYAAQARELPIVLDAFGIDRFFLVTHDRGTVIADHLCAVPGMADRIRRYVRMQQSGNRPHSEPRPPHDLFHSELGAKLIGDGTIVDIAYGVRPSTEGVNLVAVPINEQDIDRIRKEVTAAGVAESMSASFVSAGFDRELEDRVNGLFAAMTMPVLFLQGALDPGQQPNEYETVAEDVPNGYVQFIEAGHFLHLEDPTAVSTAVLQFLTREDLSS